MLSSCRAAFASSARRPLPRCAIQRTPLLLRKLNSDAARADYETKYADKLRKRAEEQGKTLDDLRRELKEQEAEKRRQQAALEAQQQAPKSTGAEGTSASSSSSSSAAPASGRRDSSPIKPLDSIFKLDRLLKGPLDASHLSALWNAYHSSRSSGTGRGFVSAVIPVATYNHMVDIASKYPNFVVPMRRPKQDTEEPTQNDSAYEFYCMEWGFHGAPPDPHANANPFAPPKPSANPQTSTVLFTPLQEYKLRQSFATPYLVLTHYTDLAQSHGVVLMRGEITPASSGAGADDGRYMLSQEDAHLLGLSVQKFYLWGGGVDTRTKLLKSFHETPAEFKWEELLEHADFPI